MNLVKHKLTVLAAALMTMSGHTMAYQYQTTYFSPTLYQDGILVGQNTQFLKDGSNTRWTDNNIQSYIYNHTYSYYGFPNTQSVSETANYDRNLQENIEVSRQLTNSRSDSSQNSNVISSKTNSDAAIILKDVSRKIDGSPITAQDVREWIDIDSNGQQTKKYYAILGRDDRGNEIREEVGLVPGQQLSSQATVTSKSESVSNSHETVYPEGGSVLYERNTSFSSNGSTQVVGSNLIEHNNTSNTSQVTLFTNSNPNGLDQQTISTNTSDSLKGYERDPVPWGSIVFVDGKPVVKQIQQDNSSQTSTTNLYQAGQTKVREDISQRSTSSSTTDTAGQILASSSSHDNTASVTYAKGQLLASSYNRDSANTSTTHDVTINVHDDQGQVLKDYSGTTKLAGIEDRPGGALIPFYDPFLGIYYTVVPNPNADTEWYKHGSNYSALSNPVTGTVTADVSTDNKTLTQTETYQPGNEKTYASTETMSAHRTIIYADGQSGIDNHDEQWSGTIYNTSKNAKYNESVSRVTDEKQDKYYQSDEDGDLVTQNGKPVEAGVVASKVTTETARNNYQLGQERKQDKTVTVNSTQSKTDILKGTSWSGDAQSTTTSITYRQNQVDGKATENAYAGQFVEKNSSASQSDARTETANNQQVIYAPESNLVGTAKDAYTDARQVMQNGQVTSDYKFNANSTITSYRNDEGAKNEENGTLADARSLLAKNELDYESTINTQESLTSVTAAGQQTSASVERGNSFKQYADGRSIENNGGKLARTDATGVNTQVEDSVVTKTNEFGNLDTTTQAHKVTTTQADKSVTSQSQTRTDSVEGIQLTAQTVGPIVTKAAIAPVQTTTITAAGIETTGTIKTNGLDMNGYAIRNVQAGTADTDATNVKQMRDGDTATLAAANAYASARTDQLSHRLNNVEKTAYSGVAISLAAQQNVPNLKPGNVAVYGGMGQYKSATAGALGVTSLMSDGRTAISAAFGFADSEVGGRVGVSYVFGD